MLPFVSGKIKSIRPIFTLPFVNFLSGVPSLNMKLAKVKSLLPSAIYSIFNFNSVPAPLKAAVPAAATLI